MASARIDPSVPIAVRRERPSLTDTEKEQITAAAGRMMLTAVGGGQIDYSDPVLSGLAGHTVHGAFVSLKRGRHLRSCCGFLGRCLPLVTALQEAAERTIWEDMRFPPISPSELAHLDFEVWLLQDPQPMQAEGDERVGAVLVGKHGLSVVRGRSHGLLLPGVPVEHGWDSRRFLDQVCVKAGLHPTAWKDSATGLSTFEGECIRGRIAESDSERADIHRATVQFNPKDLHDFAEHCARNIVALLTGATPDYYFFGKSDCQVSGLCLSVRCPDDVDEVHLSQISLRPGVPLQGTLFKLAQAAAQVLMQRRVSEYHLDRLRTGLAILFDPVLHGTVADHDLDDTAWDGRAILVVERSRSGVAFDAASGPEERLASAVQLARVRRPESAAVFSLTALSTGPKLSISSVPRPVPGSPVRPPAVAGAFYPADPRELERTVTQLVGETVPTKPWPAALVPHAGLVYSGPIAAAVFKRILIPGSVIIIGPKHTPLGVDWAIAPHGTWRLPGGDLSSDADLALELAHEIKGLELDADAHAREHAIEVELPLIAYLAPQTRVVGIAVGDADWDSCLDFAEGLANVLRRRDEPPLLVISSDMNHYATDSENRRLDKLALAALERLDPREVYETVTQNSISMCGLFPAVIVLQTLRLLGRLGQACRVSYGTSADVTGDPTRVVGYAGMLFG